MAEKAAVMTATAEMMATEMRVTTTTTSEMAAAKGEGGSRERSDSDESQCEFAKHVFSPLFEVVERT
jgi:hypothetical protein